LAAFFISKASTIFPASGKVQAVWIENRHVALLSAADFGNLRIGRNVLGRVLRTGDNGGSRPIGVWVQGVRGCQLRGRGRDFGPA
jgi:hypothetical protein